jgi:predicted transport protein
VNVRTGELEDPRGLARDLSNPKISHHGNDDCEIKFENPDDLDYALNLIEQSYNLNK